MKLVIKFFSVFLLALMVTACSDDTSTPEKAAETFTKAVYNKNIDTVSKMLYFSKEDTSGIDVETLIKSKLEEMISKAAEEAKEHGGIDKLECSPAEYTNEAKTAATCTTSITFKDGTKDGGKINLVKVDGKWLISMN